MKKMNVVHVLGSLNTGGAEYRTLEIIKKLDKNKYNVYILSINNTGEKGDLYNTFKRYVSDICELKLDLYFYQKLKHLLVKKKIDIVHSHMYLFSGLIMKIAKDVNVPNRITHIRTSGNPQKVNMVKRLKSRWLKYLTEKYSTRIIGVSRAALLSVFGKGSKNKDKFITIYNGFDILQMEKNMLEEIDKSIFQNTKQKIIHVGRFSTAKNHKRLIAIFHKLNIENPNTHLYLVGDGDEEIKDYVQSYIEKNQLDDSVTMVGNVKNVLPYLNEADLFLYPSLWEGLPGAMIEAKFANLPVVASDISPCEELQLNFSGIEVISLESNDEIWVSRILSQFNQRLETRYEFTNSIFDIDNAISTIEMIYSNKI